MSRLNRQESGFTLIELVVAMAISTVVMLAVFQSLDGFSRSSADQTERLDANDRVRTLMEQTVRDLRGASVITYAGAQDLIYTVPEATGTRTSRLCIKSGALYSFSTLPPQTAPTTATPCQTGAKLSKLGTRVATGFTYDGATSSATPSRIKNVGLTFSLDAGGSRAAESTLRASASRRTGGLLVSDSDLEATCVNGGGALLNLDVDVPGANALNVTYANDGGVTIGVLTAQGVKIPAGVTSVVATITDSLGVTQTIRRSVSC